jgi:hypothetical protein
MSRSRLRLLVTATATVAATIVTAAVLAGCGPKAPDPKAIAEKQLQAIGAPTTPMFYGTGGRVSSLQSVALATVQNGVWESFIDTSQVKAKFPAAIFPDAKVEGTFLWGASTASGGGQFVLYFNSGLEIREQFKTPQPDLWAEKSKIEVAQASGQATDDRKMLRAMINGSPGLGTGPGFQVIAGKRQERLAELKWWADGTLFTLRGYKTSMDDLLAVGRSMQ